VTKDHRIVQENVEDSEMVRLANTKARIRNKRIFPGGLAVSRTIGDAGFSSACIPTPECYAIDLAANAEQQQRFILATDGLWDSLACIVKCSKEFDSVEALVGQLAGRSSTEDDPEAAATNLMRRCLTDVGCIDDITIVVLDVSHDTAPRVL